MSNRVVFTLSQWQELEQQALIFKYLVEGIPVPPNLLLPIRRSFHSALFQNPTGGWGPILGSKVDPEPGRCRRTDGKKWRCSKDADPDSKYCERHRSRSRSRKHVETQTVSQSSSIDRSLPATGTHDQSLQFRSFNSFNQPDFGLNISQAQVQHGLYEPSSQECRYLPGGKDEIKHHSFFTEASGSSKSSKIDSLNSSWNLEPSRVNSVPPSKYPSESPLNSNYPLLLALENPGTASISVALPKEEQCCFVGGDTRKLGTGKSTKIGRELGGQPLQRFCDEWPVTREPWSHFEEDGQNPASFCTTQLSISIPMSSDFAGTNYHPP